MEAERFPATVVLGLIQDQGALAYHESLTTFDSILRRHSVMFSAETPAGAEARSAGCRDKAFSIPPWFH
jgi:hypothetical protein